MGDDALLAIMWRRGGWCSTVPVLRQCFRVGEEKRGVDEWTMLLLLYSRNVARRAVLGVGISICSQVEHA